MGLEVPKIIGFRSTPYFDELTVKMLAGQSREDYLKVMPSLAASLGSEVVRVRRAFDKRGRVRPDCLRLDVQREDALLATIPALPIPEVVDLEALEIGLTEYGDPWLLSVIGTHILVGGAMGSGKGSVLWSIIRALCPAVRDGLVQIYAIDPKSGVELSWGESLYALYECDDLQGMLALLHKVIVLMEARGRAQRSVSRQHTPTRQEPLILVIIDELADLTTCADTKLKAAFLNALELLLRKGRALGVHVIMALQDPKKNAVPFRGLIPDGIALRLKESLEVDMVLGPGSYARGARCTDIPGRPVPGQLVDGRGVAFVSALGDTEPMRVRASYVTDDEITAMAEQYRPGGPERLRVVFEDDMMVARPAVCMRKEAAGG